MHDDDWRVEDYRGMDVYVLVSEREGDGPPGWAYEVRIGQEGGDPSDAGDVEMISSGDQIFATRHAAEVAAFSAGYARVDRILGPES